MKNIYINSANEDWIADRFKDEWIKYNCEDFTFTSAAKADLIWILSPWTWNKIPKRHLKNKKVFCTIHHIDEDKFNSSEKKEFEKRDNYIDEYHITTRKTYKFLNGITEKPIIEIPFWVNQNLWYFKNDKHNIRKKYNLESSDFLIGSFQRDTEGKDLISPKLSKGPDRFIEIIKYLKENTPNLHVVLTGKRRQYIIENLNKNGIKFSYFEMTNFEELNDLYNILDLYVVASRVEGGPQSILECALTKTPIISTDVGVASKILSKESIFDMDNFFDATPDTQAAYLNVKRYTIPEGFLEFNKEFLKNEN